MDADERLAIEQTALRLLATREHSIAQLRHKLFARGGAELQVEQVLEGLVDQGLLSEARFTARYVEERMHKGFGPVRIRAELGQRGVGDDLIDVHLPMDEATWMALLARTHDRKFGRLPPADQTDFARRARFLEYRGFSPAQVSRFFKRSPLPSQITHD